MMVSLVINSKNPKVEWLNQLLKSAVGFDEVVLYIDGASNINGLEIDNRSFMVYEGNHRGLIEGFNYAVSLSEGKWFLPMCDDDYLHTDMLHVALTNLRCGAYDDFDVVHGRCSLDSGEQYGAKSFTFEELRQWNRLPFSCFIRREFFDRIGGYHLAVGAYNDWNFWLRACKAGARFKYFDGCLYHFRQSHPSATGRLIADVGGHEEAVQKVLEHV